MTKKSNITRAATVTPVSMMVDLVGKAFISATDASGEVDRIIAMTPMDGFKLKLELITGAKDMTTQEKLQAILAAENEYKQDLTDNARTCWGIAWRKTGLVLLTLSGVGGLLFTPLGKKALETAVKSLS